MGLRTFLTHPTLRLVSILISRFVLDLREDGAFQAGTGSPVSSRMPQTHIQFTSGDNPSDDSLSQDNYTRTVCVNVEGSHAGIRTRENRVSMDAEFTVTRTLDDMSGLRKRSCPVC